MSRPGASGSQSSPGDDASQRLQHTPLQVASSYPATMHPFQRDAPPEGQPGSGISLPPLRHLSRTPPTPSSERRVGNPLGNILNPRPEVPEQQRARRRSASQMDSPSPLESQPSQGLPPISRPTSVESVQDDPVMARPFQPPLPGRVVPPGRHMVTPRSPKIHRTQSLGGLNPPTGTIDAHQSPFLSPSNRPFGVDPTTSQPPLPTPPAVPRAGYFPTVPPTAPTPPPGLVRNDIRRPSVGFAQSGSASPMTSYSPYSQPASVASSQYEGHNQQNSYAPASSSGQAQDPSNPPIAMETERSMIPMAPSGQSSIQFMTIKSQQGHHVQIPVDVQAASKVADEKRKRNAGASARFRARRKEKEREASLSITRLEQKLRDAIEDMEFYRNERDFFRSVVRQQQGASMEHRRPPSPRLRRSSATSNPASSSAEQGSGSSYSPYSEPGDLQAERNVRRRTSSYHPVQGHALIPTNGPVTQASPYSAATFPAINAVSQPPAPVGRPVPPQQPFQSQQRPLPDPALPTPQRPILRDPFASDSVRYENRSWGPGQRDSRG